VKKYSDWWTKSTRPKDAEVKIKVWVTYWFDAKDKLFRVAGVYDSAKSAKRRLDQLGSGMLQQLTLNKSVKFIGENLEKK
jgi:hypothetical protein